MQKQFFGFFSQRSAVPPSFTERTGTTLVMEILEKAPLFIKATHQITKWSLPTS